MCDSEIRQSHFVSTAETVPITRTSGGNSSFTAASITRKELLLPNCTREQHEQHQQGQSVENFNALPLKAARVDDSRTLIRNFSQRVKSQVQCSLSEPLKGLGERLTAVDQRKQPQQSFNQQHQPCCLIKSLHNNINTQEQSETSLPSPFFYRRHKPSSATSSMNRSSSVRRCVSALSNKLLKQLADDDEGNGEPLEPPQAFATASTSEDSFEEDQEFLELQEREQIVDKYERGPDQNDVDPWENPDFELYKITDRYGFMHKKTPEQTEEQKRVQKELKREQKWLRMLKEWEQRHPTKLAERMWKGVPDRLRLVIWKRLTGADTMKANSREKLYKELLARARLVSRDIKQIDLDINRTYRDNLAFRRRYDVKQQSLFNVLTAYAMLNTEVGYCQGMSQIAALFLMYMDEEEAFWSLHGLLVNRKYGMHGFFVPGFPKLHRFQNHYDKVLLKYLPRVKSHLDNIGIPPIYLTKWWFGCFLDRVPFPLALRLWDAFLYFGDCILIAMAYNIMKMHRKRIVKLCVEDFMEFIQNSLAKDFGFTDDEVMESLGECLKRLQNDRMAIPPPPNPNATAELPTKPLGPILTRSMLDIRSDIDSVYSRCSRANSVTGRSPMVRRHQTQNQHIPPPNHQKVISALASSRLQCQNQQPLTNSTQQQTMPKSNASGSRPGSLKGERPYGSAADKIHRHGNQATTSTFFPADVDTVPSSAVGPPVEPFLRRVGSTKHRIQRPPPVPDEDGFVRMSPRSIKQKQPQEKPQKNIEDEAIHSRLEQSNSLSITAQQQSKRIASVIKDSAINRNCDNGRSGSELKRVPLASKLPQPRSSSLKNTPSAAPQQPLHLRRGDNGTVEQPRPTQRQQEQMMFGYSAPEHRQQRSEGGGISEGRHRVHRAANNVTYISVDADEDSVNLPIVQKEQQNQQHHSSLPPQRRHQIDDDQRRHKPIMEEKQRMPSRLPYYCPPPDYDEENGNNGMGASPNYGRTGGAANRSKSAIQQQKRPTVATSLVDHQTPSAGRNRTKRSEPMAKPLFAQDETRVVRRF
ncbi:hypothetical protein niasHT_002297 [Heterodera trifolii]|uniref:Rab-GAP TBC domain-containing protein n=1 Tax=Heterodera trifolii TaxID=157864 RepID=A0ABD2LM23_9BILA